jgi:hypothetical protein
LKAGFAEWPLLAAISIRHPCHPPFSAAAHRAVLRVEFNVLYLKKRAKRFSNVANAREGVNPHTITRISANPVGLADEFHISSFGVGVKGKYVKN